MKTNVIIDAKAIEDYNIDDIETYRPRPASIPTIGAYGG